MFVTIPSMEPRPDAQENELNDQLKSFASLMLDNELVAAAIANRNNESAPQEKGWRRFGGEPSLMPREDGMILAGIQFGYEHNTPTSQSRQYVYTDFFVINPISGQAELSEELTEVTNTMDPKQATVLAEEAWQLWLKRMHGLMSRIEGVFSDPAYKVTGHADAMKIVVNKYTGEIGPFYNMPRGHAVEIKLPPLGTPLAN